MAAFLVLPLGRGFLNLDLREQRSLVLEKGIFIVLFDEQASAFSFRETASSTEIQILALTKSLANLLQI